MDTKALEKFCPWARTELIDAVKRRCTRYGLDDAGRAEAGPDSDVVGGRVLDPAERAQRAALYACVEAEGWEAFCEREAYGWFNRLVAIRYMEVRGFLPCRVRMLSAQDGSFDPECLRSLGELDLPGLDVAAALRLSVGGCPEDTYRMVLVAQCNQLADVLPDVFGHVGDADALTLPDGLLLRGEHDVLYHLVADVPEDAWSDVEALGWSYQFYNSERKDEFFKSKRKAKPEDVAPATQLFTPEWIVRYMVENSLGRLWMLNHPESSLRERMEYYIEPDAEHEDFIRISSPEEITVCDPACGSGHILSYAFELLVAMYEEVGYREREIPELILSKNLAGLEIDPRAAQIASLVLAMRAREHDRRFLTRDGSARADITVLESVPLTTGDLTLCGKKLPEALAHLGEVGSLLAPTSEDITNLKAELAACETDLLSNGRAARVKDALAKCESLACRFDVVVANPPYMGSSSFNPFMSGWVKKNYPDSKSDLCTCFIERGFNLAKDRGYAAMVTMQSWMFLGSFEKMRNKLIAEKGIVTMAHLGTRAFDAIGGEVVSVTADVLYNSKFEGSGAYFRLVDINGSEPKRQALLEAIKNPACGWFYRRDAETFHQIPGSPIAYWASETSITCFSSFPAIRDLAWGCNGMTTGENDRFLRLWHEVSCSKSNRIATNPNEAENSGLKWFPYNKGGDYRRWYGNEEWLINWRCNGIDAREYGHLVPRSQKYMFKPEITWSKISSGKAAFRLKDAGHLFDVAGLCLFPNKDTDFNYLLAFCNSSVAAAFLSFLCPTLNFEVGSVSSMPISSSSENYEVIEELASRCLKVSRDDYDSLETSWDFKRHPLV